MHLDRGIAARNGILKISHTSTEALHEEAAVRSENYLSRGSLDRLTPVLMSDALGGVGPVAAAHRCCSAGKENPQHPVAVTIFGGLITRDFSGQPCSRRCDSCGSEGSLLNVDWILPTHAGESARVCPGRIILTSYGETNGS